MSEHTLERAAHAVNYKLPEEAYHIVFIPLTRGKFAVIDEADLPLVGRHKWHALRVKHDPGRFIASTTICSKGGAKNRTKRSLLMHRLIKGEPPCLIDHANWDSLDNRRSNLRLANKSLNAANTKKLSRSASGFRGVSQNVRGWTAVLKAGQRTHWLGRYATAEEAARAYDAAARRHFGEFARLNFPDAINEPPPPKLAPEPNHGRHVRCVETGQEWHSIRSAARDLGLTEHTWFRERILRGLSVNGMTFRFE